MGGAGYGCGVTLDTKFIPSTPVDRLASSENVYHPNVFFVDT